MTDTDFSPVFLIGPGRSGTTLLYKVLCLHSEIGFLSNYDSRLPRWLPSAVLARVTHIVPSMKTWAWFNKDGSAYLFDRPLLRKIVPSPVEGEEVYTRAGVNVDEWKTEFPPNVSKSLRQEFIRLQKLQGTSCLLLKRTANNRRLPGLQAAFPNAKYIYLLRDGRAVAYSLPRVNWWAHHKIWWKGDKTPSELANNGENMLALAAGIWKEEIRCIEEGFKHIPSSQILPVRYEAFLADPIGTVHNILAFVGLCPTASFDSRIGSLGLCSREEPWKKKFTDDELKLVLDIQKDDLARLGYL